MSKHKLLIASLCFVLGFSLLFSALGVALQTLSYTAQIVQLWLSRLAGIALIIFGLEQLGLLRIPWPQVSSKQERIQGYLGALLFGMACAIAWTPCIGPILGAILALASSSPHIAFGLLLSYSLGLGVAFVAIAMLLDLGILRLHSLKNSRVSEILKKVFALVLILVGILVFTQSVAMLASIPFLRDLLVLWQPLSGSQLSFGIAFIGGLLSLLSPCVLGLIPAYLAYLTSLLDSQ